MRKKYRIYGMLICLIVLIFSFPLITLTQELRLNELGVMLVMFVAGWGLRETLQRDGET